MKQESENKRKANILYLSIQRLTAKGTTMFEYDEKTKALNAAGLLYEYTDLIRKVTKQQILSDIEQISKDCTDDMLKTTDMEAWAFKVSDYFGKLKRELKKAK